MISTVQTISENYQQNLKCIPSSSQNSGLKSILRPNSRIESTIGIIVSDTVNGGPDWFSIFDQGDYRYDVHCAGCFGVCRSAD